MRILHTRISFLLILLSTVQFTSGQIFINEFLASNATITTDPDNNEFADWIELYNAGGSAVNLKNYFLTDNLNTPGKWQIPSDLIIEARGFVLIWTDGTNTGTHTGFKLSSLGEEIGLFSPSLKLLDSVVFPLQKTDVSYGRKTDGATEWAYFLVPTPQDTNNTDPYVDFAKNVPEFSLPGQIYSSPVTVEMSTLLGGDIRYTTDGTEPALTSTLYTGPLALNATTIVRARIFKPFMIPGPVVTQSYFVDAGMGSRDLPVVSIATDPKNFWDSQLGIYVQDFKPLWEIPVNIELFENNHSDRAAINLQAGIKVNGLYSWKLPQKMLGIYFKNQYGAGSLDYPILFNKNRSSYKTFALRASGNDWSNTLFRDILGQGATQLNMKLDIMGFRPSVVYVNGQYMGIHNIREKVDEDFIAQNNKIPAGTFDMVENTDYAEAGDLLAYNHLLTLTAKDLSIQSNFDAVAEITDIENFTDLVITEMAVGNTSIDHNVMAWKPKSGGKWKWVLMDLDRGFFNLTNAGISFYTGQTVWPFSRLMENAAYQTYFGRRLATHLYTSFNPARMNMLIDERQQAIEAEIPAHVQRWLGTTSSYGNAMPSVNFWYNEVSKLRAYTQERPGILLYDLKNYGYTGSWVNLGLSSVPTNGGTITLDGLNLPEASWNGPYLPDSPVPLSAQEKPGYRFLGWKASTKKVLVPRGATWKYLDDGSDQGNTWAETVNDASWQSGQAELGYGDNDEATIVSYGANSKQKYVTTYFRHHFNLTAEDLKGTSYVINLKKDDGAVVYLNGHELIRANLPRESCTYKSYALISIASYMESFISSWLVDASSLVAGENILSVEMHQDLAASSDLSFDLEFLAWMDTNPGYVSSSKDYNRPLTSDTHLSAIFEATGQCLVPELISTDLVLRKDCSPYAVQGDLHIMPGATLTIEPGVELWMPPKGTIFVEGVLNAIGTEEQQIVLKSNPSTLPASWGILSFVNTPAPSHLSWVSIENASEGPVPIRDYAAISAYNGDLVLDHLTMTNIDANPIVARYSDVTLTSSSIHSKVVGDAINVKYGKALVENCVFEGNGMPDTDAVDYDDVIGGILRNCVIKNFLGFNSDGVDIGEKARDILIDSVQIYNIFDKGISVGQLSSVSVRNSTFTRCGMGLGLKDLSEITIDHCTFYGNGTSVECFEKNPGSAGGIAVVTNSILSNSSLATVSSDAQSSLNVHYSLSDNDPLPPGESNLLANPLFENPTFFNFNLNPSSPAINTGSDKGNPSTMGSHQMPVLLDPLVLICQVFINSLNTIYPEFIALVNPSIKPADLSGYFLDQGVTSRIPDGTILNPGDTLYITDNPSTSFWSSRQHVLSWTDGKLSNDGEAIQLRDSFGLVVDHIRYAWDGRWPEAAFNMGEVLSLVHTDVDNHFPENWTSIGIDKVLHIPDKDSGEIFRVYPNPTLGPLTIFAPQDQQKWVEIYSAPGVLLGRVQLDASGRASVNLAKMNQSLVILKLENKVQKVVMLR